MINARDAPPDRRRAPRGGRLAQVAAPLLVAGLAVTAWEVGVRVREVPEFVLPAPSAVLTSLQENWASLAPAWLVTLKTMAIAISVAVFGGLLLAVVFSLSPAVELSLFPYAVMLQVTPLVAVAPLLFMWTSNTPLVLVLCATIVAFFPVLAGTAVGLRSADPGLRDLFDLCGASRWQRLRFLQAPTALPHFLTGFRTAVNLSLVGTVVGEFVTGAGGEQSGLAAAVFEGQYRLDTPFMFAALGLISLTGVACYFATHTLSHWVLSPWHESTQ